MASYIPLARLPPYHEPSQGSQDRSEPERRSVSSESLIEPSPPTPPSLEPVESAETINQPESTHSLIGSWWLEFSALILCLASFAALLYLLIAFDGQPISAWTKFPLSLNALISILSGISKASLSFVISMCLSQTKWNWATRYSEPLIAFERFDAASRGAWGSLRLMRSFLRRPHWASLGALAAIILLAFEPLIQVILTFEDQPVTLNGTVHAQIPSIDDAQATGATALIGRSSLLNAGFWTGLAGTDALVAIMFPGSDGKATMLQYTNRTHSIRPDMGVAAAIWNGFSPLITTQNLWPAFTCTTGNCSWDNFASIAVCSSCHDLSKHVKKTSRVIRVPNIYLPGGYSGDAPDVSNNKPDANLAMGGGNFSITKYMIPEVGLELSNYDGKPRSDTLVLAMQFLQANESWHDNETTWEDTAVTAQECSLFFCVNEYETVIEEGVLRERVNSSWNIRTPGSYSSSVEEEKEYLRYANQTLDMNGAWVMLTDLQIAIPDQHYTSRAGTLSQQSFNMTRASIVSLIKTLKDGFELPDCLVNCTVDTENYIYPALGSSRLSSLMTGLGEANNIPLTFENVALSLTKWMRDREFASSSAARGDVTMLVVVTRVEWMFLGFPAATLIVGIVFAVLSIWETHRLKRGAWKDSAIATLAYAPTGEFRDRLQEAVVTGKILEVGRMAEVKMEYQDGLGRLVLKKEKDQVRV